LKSVLPFLPFILISSLRKGVGTDYYFTYYRNYYLIAEGTNLFKREFIPFFYYFVRAFTFIFKDSQVFFAVCSFIFLTNLAYSVSKMNIKSYCSILVFICGGYFFASMSNIRQWLAISCVTVALYFMVNHKYFRGILFCIIAFCFHTSTLIILPFVFLSSFNSLKKYGRYIAIILLILTPFYLLIISLLKDKIGYEAFFMLEKSTSLMIYIIPYGVILALILIYYDKLCEVNPYAFGLTCIFTMGVVFSLLSSEMSLESTIRLTNWFLWPLIYIIPSFLKINKNKIVSYAIVTILLFLLAIISIDRIGFNSWYEVLPYRDIWGNIYY
jgi:hypothetical protein